MLKKGGKINIPEYSLFKSLFSFTKKTFEIFLGENFPIHWIYSIKKQPKISQFLVQKMTKFVTSSNKITCKVTSQV